MGEAELEKTAAIATEFMKRKHGFSTIEAACFHDGYLTGARDTKARLALLEQVVDAARLCKRELGWMLRAHPERKGGHYEHALDAVIAALAALDAAAKEET